MKEKLVEFLKLTKGKIAVAILTPYVWNLLLYSIIFLISLDEGVAGLPSFGEWIILTAGKVHIYLVESLIYYPFACGVVILWDKGWKELREDKKIYKLVKIGIFVFNPLSVALIFNFLTSIFLLFYSPKVEGLEIIEVYPNSTAEEMEIDEKIGRVIELIEYRRYGWVGNSRTVIKNVTKNNPSISDAKEVLGYINTSNTFDELYIEIYLGGGYLEHPNSMPLGIRVRDAQGNEAVL